MCRAASHVSSRRELEAGSRGLPVGVGSALFSSASRRSKIRAYLAETSAHRGSAFGAAAGAGLAGAGDSRVGVGGATGTGSGACALGGTALVGLPAGELGLEPLPPIVVMVPIVIILFEAVIFRAASTSFRRNAGKLAQLHARGARDGDGHDRHDSEHARDDMDIPSALVRETGRLSSAPARRPTTNPRSVEPSGSGDIIFPVFFFRDGRRAPRRRERVRADFSRRE